MSTGKIIYFGDTQNFFAEIKKELTKKRIEAESFDTDDNEDVINEISENGPVVLVYNDMNICTSSLGKIKNIVKKSKSKVLLVHTGWITDSQLNSLQGLGLYEALKFQGGLRNIAYKIEFSLKSLTAIKKVKKEKKEDVQKLATQKKEVKENNQVIEEQEEAPEQAVKQVQDTETLPSAENEKLSHLFSPEQLPLVDEFRNESKELCAALVSIAESMEEEPENIQLYRDYANQIDRIMGMALTLNLDEIAKFSELGKVIAQNCADCQNDLLLEIASSILFNTADLLKVLIHNLEEGKLQSLKESTQPKFVSRLHWLSTKFKAQKSEKLDQNAIDDLLNSLGMAS